MVNILVSIRLPKKLVEELKEISKSDHFMDTSEAVRSILRKAYLENKNKDDIQISRLTDEIKQTIDSTKKERIIHELKTLLDEISKNE